MPEDLDDHRRIFDGGDDLQSAAAVRAVLHVDIEFRFGVPHLAGMMAALLPLCCLTASLPASIATLARSFKEAQSYMGILMIGPMLLGLIGAVIHWGISRGCMVCRCSGSI
jgi:hypothetical protein